MALSMPKALLSLHANVEYLCVDTKYLNINAIHSSVDAIHSNIDTTKHKKARFSCTLLFY